MLPGPNLILMNAISFLQKHQAQTETNLILQIKNVCALHVVRLLAIARPSVFSQQQDKRQLHITGSRVGTRPALKPHILSHGPSWWAEGV